MRQRRVSRCKEQWSELTPAVRSYGPVCRFDSPLVSASSRRSPDALLLLGSAAVLTFDLELLRHDAHTRHGLSSGSGTIRRREGIGHREQSTTSKREQ